LDKCNTNFCNDLAHRMTPLCGTKHLGRGKRRKELAGLWRQVCGPGFVRGLFGDLGWTLGAQNGRFRC